MNSKLPFMTPEVRREFDPHQVVELTPLVRRITAPNAGFMTGPGTNCYLVGREAVAVIDPGIADEAHAERIAAAGAGKIRWILVTHTHPDHSPGAARLAQLTGAEQLGHGGRLAWAHDETFTPDRTLGDGDRLTGPDFSLRALHTPGHASNHLCYLLQEEGVLFAGDQVMYGSTVVIAPPDGDMIAYLAALQRLLAEPIQRIAPAHGRLMDAPGEVLQGIIDHRLVREGKVIDALQSMGPGTLEQLVPRVYDDVPTFMHDMAARSLLAHLLKLRAEGRAVGEMGQEWRMAAD